MKSFIALIALACSITAMAGSEGWYAADLELASFRLVEKTSCAKK